MSKSKSIATFNFPNKDILEMYVDKGGWVGLNYGEVIAIGYGEFCDDGYGDGLGVDSYYLATRTEYFPNTDEGYKEAIDAFFARVKSDNPGGFNTSKRSLESILGKKE
jgi:hypothetical protein